MKLLICTQTVDRGDPTLGFFHEWIAEFARHCERVIVVCLFEGEHSLPENVTVLSLGKERRREKIHPTLTHASATSLVFSYTSGNIAGSMMRSLSI
ncbi:hypothetical protein HY416_00780 [Candidatus Kaiserbacteria bacterium]|nr:hypothetical protein [Candidatus Kaiserbacteria bacterium]